MKPHILRLAAERDIERAFAFYLGDASTDAALGFVHEINVALSHIEQHPGTGSPRYGEWCDAPGLRLWLLTRYPYAVAYVERDTHVDVLRVLHQHADIPAQLSDWL